MKCATTSLTEMFAQHPEIFVSSPKEIDFFCKDEVFSRGWSWYESLFSGGEGKIAIGEGSTSYTKMLMFPRTVERVAKYMADAKLIYIVRNPLERIESHWLHLVATGQRSLPLKKAFEKWPHLIDTSLYWKQINAYRRHFPDDRIHVLFFEDFVKDPLATVSRCYEFLGVDSMVARTQTPRISNVSASFSMDHLLLRALRRFPGARRMKNAFPALTSMITSPLRKSLPVRPSWPAELYQTVAEQLMDDSARFLGFYGKPTDFWPLPTLAERDVPLHLASSTNVE